MNTDNPLLKKSTLKNQAPHFSEIKNEHYLPAIEAAIAEARKNIDAIKNNPAPADFENTILALEYASETLGTVAGVFYNQLSANGDDEMQEIAKKIGPLNARYSSDVSLDPVIFARVKAVYDARAGLNLDVEEAQLLEDTYKGFERSGANLDEKGKKRMREISERMSVLGPDFNNNVSKSSEKFELWVSDLSELSGIPAHTVEAAKDAATKKGRPNDYLFSLDAPTYMSIVTYADNRGLREKIWRAFASRAWGDEFDNSKLLTEIVALRDERAKLLGYKNHAAFVLSERMAETPENVIDFLGRLKDAYKPAAKKDLKELKDFARKQGLNEDLRPWDVSYYSEKLQEEKYKFSSEELRPYFQLDNVLEGCFNHFTKLFGVRFVANNQYETWHEDVKAYDVVNDKDGSFVGTLFADFHPRTGKKQGAWMTSYRDQGLFNGKVERPVIAIVCNFTKPTSTTPSLLTHDEVTTLFHEMGHAMHGMLSDVKHRGLAGTNVKWDFVELPSQVQENWAYKKETLDLFAKHYQTGAPIPDSLIEKLNEAKNFNTGWIGLRQVMLGTLDMKWHTADPKKIKDPAAFEDKAIKDLTFFPRMAGPTSASFSHIFAGGYAAGYYSYKWAEVLDADVFALFEQKGLYDRQTADAYREKILARGGSRKPGDLFRDFMGRDPDPDALLRREGLLSGKKPKGTKPSPRAALG